MPGYANPLTTRYASREMSETFGDERKFRTWRRIWVALAEAERALGVPISGRQIAAMKRAEKKKLNLDRAARYERELRHDVMAHIRAFGDQCPAARGILHLGATSCDVVDNADLLAIRDALELVALRLARAIELLSEFARSQARTPCLGYTHFQPAQPTTLGKRACLWMQDLLLDIAEVEQLHRSMRLRGIKGTTGTGASFLALFGGSKAKVKKLDALVANKLGFSKTWPVTGQTYPRKFDAMILGALAGIGQSAHKFANDVRILQGLKELEEPFGRKQVGSSAMAYKRNPMRSERATALSRHLLALTSVAQNTAAEQWLERTLDDSAARRIAIPEAFLAADAILILLADIADGLVVNRAVVAARLAAELPFMATEEILMAAVKAGGDRQALHERIRRHSMAAAREVKGKGRPNDLLARIAGDPAFKAVHGRLATLTNAKRFVGLAPEQVRDFLTREVAPALRPYRGKTKRLGGKVRV